MADIATKPSDQHQEEKQNTNPILDFFSNLLKLFNNLPLPFPPFVKTKKPEEEDPLAAPVAVVGESAASENKASVVKFPRPSQETLPSLKLEPDEVEERNTNPVVLWQVYAIGGFLVLRWAWTRWNERRDRKKPSDEDRPPAVE